MPFVAAAKSDAEFRPVCTAETDVDFDGNAATASMVESRRFKRVIAAVMLSALLVGAVALGHASRRDDVRADTEFLISESHFSQTCSWRCNRKFWVKGGVAGGLQEYLRCCQGCSGGVCTFPCTDACRQKREKGSAKCSGDAVCMKLVQEEHKQCCSRCPGSTCVAKESEDALIASEEVADDLAQGSEESNSEAIAKTCGGNAAGAACQFPFEYQGLQYTACTSMNSDQPWCYTSEAGKWGNCKCPPS